MIAAISVPLTHGYSALVSPQDYDRVCMIHWRVKFSGGAPYAVAHVPGSGKRGRDMFMHRFILEAGPREIIDHRDGDGLNNTRENLRSATTQQNICNQQPHRDKKTSRLKGVYRLKGGKYRAQIMVQRRKINLGDFREENAAARAYDDAARLLHGDFARLNFPEGVTSA
jgi:hypothetical protein